MTKDKISFFTNSLRLFTGRSLIPDQKNIRILVPILLFISSVFFFGFLHSISTADATSTLDQSIQQFQKNLQSSITKEIQTIANNTNNINCSNSISIQTQTNNNGQTSSTTKNDCNNKSIISSSSMNPFINKNLSGAIVSTEYDLQTGNIISSIFGNWSLKTNSENQIDFKTTFTKQPVNLSPSQTESSSASKQSDETEYNLSNFRVTTVNQQDSDITYKGTINTIEKNLASGVSGSTTTNTFEDAKVSISILDGRILVINFDKQSNLFNEFTDIPLVGLVTR
ncbi:hypothetical protein [Candidatus Nitrosocosmicus sp. R]